MSDTPEGAFCSLISVGRARFSVGFVRLRRGAVEVMDETGEMTRAIPVASIAKLRFETSIHKKGRNSGSYMFLSLPGEADLRVGPALGYAPTLADAFGNRSRERRAALVEAYRAFVTATLGEAERLKIPVMVGRVSHHPPVSFAIVFGGAGLAMLWLLLLQEGDWSGLVGLVFVGIGAAVYFIGKAGLERPAKGPADVERYLPDRRPFG